MNSTSASTEPVAHTNQESRPAQDSLAQDSSAQDSLAQPCDLEFFWDPICPFAWVTSRWVEDVAKLKNFSVDWRLISLTLLNEDKDYSKFPPSYRQLHEKGLAMLRVAAAARKAHGPSVMGPLYTEMGKSIWYQSPPPGDDLPIGQMDDIAQPEHLRKVLVAAGLPEELADSATDASLDAELRSETELALSRTGKDVGTPIITYQPPDGPSFFGPVISEPPKGDDALELWDAVLTLAKWSGFSEIKRTRRDMPRLPLLEGMRNS